MNENILRKQCFRAQQETKESNSLKATIDYGSPLYPLVKSISEFYDIKPSWAQKIVKIEIPKLIKEWEGEADE